MNAVTGANTEEQGRLGRLTRLVRPRRLSRGRIIVALAAAVAADAIQFLFGFFGPPGWIGDDLVDVAAMFPTMWALGFHILLLPTFVSKLFPVADMLPTWTGCVFAVIALRKRAEKAEPPVIEVEATHIK